MLFWLELLPRQKSSCLVTFIFILGHSATTHTSSPSSWLPHKFVTPKIRVHTPAMMRPFRTVLRKSHLRDKPVVTRQQSCDSVAETTDTYLSVEPLDEVFVQVSQRDGQPKNQGR